uniref:Uncharacterized protein n=1 Tax=Cucumis melo TaxID=3656 RepID=A0A9I9E6K0_CUCME
MSAQKTRIEDGLQLHLKMTCQLTLLLTGPYNVSPTANLSNFVVSDSLFVIEGMPEELYKTIALWFESFRFSI